MKIKKGVDVKEFFNTLIAGTLGLHFMIIIMVGIVGRIDGILPNADILEYLSMHTIHFWESPLFYCALSTSFIVAFIQLLVGEK